MAPPEHSLDDLRIHRESKEKRQSSIWMVLAILVLLLAGLGAWFLFFRSSAVEVKTVLARQVTSGNGGERTVLNASGYVTARREATVSSKVTGKVVEVLVEEGMRVKQGQTLARLDDTNLRAGFDLAQAQLAAARAAFDETRVRIREAELNLKRISALAGNRIAPESDLDAAKAELDSLRARLVQQEAQASVADREVASWQQQLDDTIIRAPFDGIVTSKAAQPGEMISPVSAGGGFTRTGICTIVDMDSLEIEIDVNESYINRVSSGQPVVATLDAYPDWKIPAKVIAIIPTADRQKSTVRVRVGFDKLEPRILPQMSIKVAFQESGDAGAVPLNRIVIVPRNSVVDRDGRKVVLLNNNGRVERRAVTLASVQDQEAILSAGLSGGERVIVDPPANLTEGAAVKETSI